MATLVSVEEGALVRYVITWPPGESIDGSRQAPVVVLMRRPGGMLIGLPNGFLTPEDLAFEWGTDEPELVFGPGARLSVPLALDDGAELLTDSQVEVHIVDVVYEAVAPHIVPEEEASGDASELHPFHADYPGSLPEPQAMLQAARDWLARTDGSLDYHTALEVEEEGGGPQLRRQAPRGGTTRREEPKAGKRPTVALVSKQLEDLAATLPAITSQLSMLQERQDRLEKQQAAPAVPFKTPQAGGLAAPISALLHSPGPPLHTIAKLVGPPPKVRAMEKQAVAPTLPVRAYQEDDPIEPVGDPSGVGTDPYAAALLEQSRALRALVSQLQSTASDPMSELASGGASSSLSMKGLTNREKLQRELALKEGKHFLKICQTVAKRMSPSGTIPMSLEETSGVSLLGYLERFGGYGQSNGQWGTSSTRSCRETSTLPGIIPPSLPP